MFFRITAEAEDLTYKKKSLFKYGWNQEIPPIPVSCLISNMWEILIFLLGPDEQSNKILL